jgi:hypothetical protein
MRETKIDPILFARDMVAITPPLKLTGRWRKPKVVCIALQHVGAFTVAIWCTVDG